MGCAVKSEIEVLAAVMAERGYWVVNSYIPLRSGEPLKQAESRASSTLFDMDQLFYVIGPTDEADAQENYDCAIKHGGPEAKAKNYKYFYRIGTD